MKAETFCNLRTLKPKMVKIVTFCITKPLPGYWRLNQMYFGMCENGLLGLNLPSKLHPSNLTALFIAISLKSKCPRI